ncbi:MAG TPA: hydrogenase maturation protease [Bacteroidota bacterium]|nr:hydrogenase maturation protease [Bacteroidota bacterium]
MIENQDKTFMSSPLEKKILIIGYGNTLRGDDGIGQIIAEKIEKLNFKDIDILALHQLTPDIAGKIIEYKVVFFIDASQNTELNEVQVLSLEPSESSPKIEHAMNPEDILKLAEELYNFYPKSFCVLVPARNFSFSESLSDLTKSMIQPAIKIITEKIKNFN